MTLGTSLGSYETDGTVLGTILGDSLGIMLGISDG